MFVSAPAKRLDAVVWRGSHRARAGGHGRTSGSGRPRARLVPSARTRCPSCHSLPRGRGRPGIGLEAGPKRGSRVADPRLDRTQRQVERLGDLAERPAEVVMEDEGRALLRWQPPETTLKGVT